MRSNARDGRGAIALTALVPGLLRSYTNGASRVDVALDGDATVDGALRALDARFRGLRFRIVDEQDAIRPHIRIFVDRNEVRALSAPVHAGAELMIVGALSGG
jgi:molybdopterin synthase sulfur carrier subunit